MAHEREYVAAVTGMLEASEPPFAVGDLVSGVTKGKAWSGTICGFDEGIGPLFLNVTVDLGLLMVPAGDVTSRTRPTAHDFAVGDELRFRLAGWPHDSSACGRVISVSEATGTLIVHCEGMTYEVNPAVWPAGDRLEV
jgi:hypothetical protein